LTKVVIREIKKGFLIVPRELKKVVPGKPDTNLILAGSVLVSGGKQLLL
jgi:hypothetical protein